MNHRELISSESRKLNHLHKEIGRHYLYRNKNPKPWKLACKDFHAYQSPIDSYIDKIFGSVTEYDSELIEFSILFLELDPRFYRSGYIKEEILRKFRKLEFSKKDNQRLRIVLLNAVERRAGREFKKYCSLYPQVKDEELEATLINISKNESSKGNRARLMLRYTTSGMNSM